MIGTDSHTVNAGGQLGAPTPLSSSQSHPQASACVLLVWAALMPSTSWPAFPGSSRWQQPNSLTHQTHPNPRLLCIKTSDLRT